MKIGVTQIILQGKSLDDVLKLCQEAGYETLELFFLEGGDLDINLSDEAIQQVGAQCRAAGIDIVSLLAWYKERGSFLSPTLEKRVAARRSLLRALEIASLLGVKTTLLHPGSLESQGSYLQTWDTFIQEMRAIVGEAADRGVTIAVENVWNKFMLTPMEARELLDAVDHPNFALYLDTANLMPFGFTEHWIRDLGDKIAMVHFKDFIRSEHRFVDLMDGDTDWASVMAALREIGYTGSVIHEVAGDRDKQLEMARRMRQIVSL